MSQLLQKRRQPQQLDRPTSSDQRTRNRSPQSWFRPSNSRSLSNLGGTQHPHRTLGFSSIKELARSSSRQTLRTLPTATYHQPYSHGCSPPKHGEVRLPKAAKDPEPSLPSKSELQLSRSSSVESLPNDKSGISNDSTYATTPSPAKPHAFQLLESSSPVQRKNMGNKASTVLKKPIPHEDRQSSATTITDSERPGSTPTSARLQKPATFPARRSSVIVNVPRRRSSLTVLHLDSSHFETPDPQPQDLQHRASVLSEPRQRPSILSDTFPPITTIVTSSNDTNPTIPVKKTETQSPALLSPPLLSPQLSSFPLSSASSHAASVNSRNSVIPLFIHLPKTFPDGSIPVPAPPLTITHHKCYQSHRRILLSRNKINPVPCMTCGEKVGEVRWKCIWCALRICGVCMAEFDAKHRDLDKLLAWLETGKKSSKEGRAKDDEVQELDGGGDIEVKKEDVPMTKESHRRSTAGMIKLLRSSK